MGAYDAFQRNAFQDNAFQMDDPNTGGGGGWGYKRERDRKVERRVKKLKEEYEKARERKGKNRKLASITDPFILTTSMAEVMRRSEAKLLSTEPLPVDRVDFESIMANALALKKLIAVLSEERRLRREEEEYVVMLLLTID